jgi:hypothetical protein
MQVEYLKLCKNAELSNGEQKIIDEFDIIETGSLPLVLDRVFVVAKVSLNEEDINLFKEGIYSIEIRIENPVGKLTHEHPIRVNTMDVEFVDNPKNGYVKFIKHGLNNMPFLLYGMYRIQLTVHNKPICATKLVIQEIKTTFNK